jgi:GTPase Era involved in 16S rRNA processing
MDTRFLAMAADYDARANVADKATEQTFTQTDTELPEATREDATKGSTEPDRRAALSVKPRVRITREPKKTIVV